MKHRSDIAIILEILGALLQQPRLKTSLAQIANLNLARIDEQFLDPMQRANLVKKDQLESHDVFRITDEGRHYWEELYTLQKKLYPDHQYIPPDRPWG